jgi:CBS domain containing-hemolysin-like protein
MRRITRISPLTQAPAGRAIDLSRSKAAGASAPRHTVCGTSAVRAARLPAERAGIISAAIVMGLFKLLTFPVSGPLVGTKWALKTLMSEAERRYYDEAAIRQEMAELERQMLAGQIDDETFDRQEEALLNRLLEAREYYQRKAEERGEP